MKRKWIDALWVMGVLLMAGFCLSACNRELDVQTVFPFEVSTMPVPIQIKQGETVEVFLKKTLREADALSALAGLSGENSGMLVLSHITKTFNRSTVNEKKALCGIDLHLQAGDFVSTTTRRKRMF